MIGIILVVISFILSILYLFNPKDDKESLIGVIFLLLFILSFIYVVYGC